MHARSAQLLLACCCGAGCFNASGRLRYETTWFRGPQSGTISARMGEGCSATVARDGAAWRVASLAFYGGWKGQRVYLLESEVDVDDGAREFKLTASSCSRYEAHSWISDDRRVHARLAVECALSDGSHVSGEMQSDDCAVR
jgi:hypothetical protein